MTEEDRALIRTLTDACDKGVETFRRVLTAQGRQGAVVTVTVQVYRGAVWVTVIDLPFVAEAILPPAHADSLSDILTHGATEARHYEKD